MLQWFQSFTTAYYINNLLFVDCSFDLHVDSIPHDVPCLHHPDAHNGHVLLLHLDSLLFLHRGHGHDRHLHVGRHLPLHSPHWVPLHLMLGICHSTDPLHQIQHSPPHPMT